MQALLDLAPLVAFFVTYYLGGIYVATAVLMVAMLALLLLDLLRLRRVPPLHLLSAVLVLALGSATLILRDPRFLKWKPTIFLWLIALASLVSPWVGRAPLAQRLLAPMISRSETVPRRTWLKLNMLWVGFYALLGALNLWVAASASERAWVNFKVFGLSAAFALFAIAQTVWLAARTEAVAARLS
jgi:intracellular septation protein